MLKTNTFSLHSFLEWLFVTNNDNKTVQVSSHSRHSGKMSAQADQLAEAKKKKGNSLGNQLGRAASPISREKSGQTSLVCLP